MESLLVPEGYPQSVKVMGCRLGSVNVAGQPILDQEMKIKSYFGAKLGVKAKDREKKIILKSL